MVMKINKHPIKPGSVVIFNFNYDEMHKNGMSPLELDVFIKSFVDDVKNALPFDSVVVTGINIIESIDIFEADY